MQVVAMKPGFYNGSRRRTGDVFDMNVPVKDGKPVIPKWVKAAPNAHEAKKEAAAAKKAESDKKVAGAIAASGGQAAKDKVAALGEQLAG